MTVVYEKNYLGTNLSQFVDKTTTQQTGGSENCGHQPVETGTSARTPFQLR